MERVSQRNPFLLARLDDDDDDDDDDKAILVLIYHFV